MNAQCMTYHGGPWFHVHLYNENPTRIIIRYVFHFRNGSLFHKNRATDKHRYMHFRSSVDLQLHIIYSEFHFTYRVFLYMHAV